MVRTGKRPAAIKNFSDKTPELISDLTCLLVHAQTVFRHEDQKSKSD